jgi:D-serine deaminase-like pyridoxal phosphate-dependent protein
VETSPGTLILWDAGYGERYSDLDFLYGAVLLTRVISLPDRNLLCLDLGHKAIAAEMPHPRVRLIGLPPHEFVNHSEEHLVIKLEGADKYKPGDVIYGIPWHICPTVARYPFAYAVRDNSINETWQIEARDRVIHV